MPLRGVMVEREKLIAHGNWNEPLKELLLDLYRYGVAVMDTSIPFADEKCSFADCLMIADCEETVQKAKKWNMAVLGYQPPAERRIVSSLDMIVEGFEEIDFYFLERIYQRFHHLPWTVIETERCLVREITLEDLDALYEVYRPKEITRYLDGLYEERDKEEEYTKAYIENMYRFYGYGLWVVIEKATGELIGRAGLEHLEIEDEVCLQLGYVIAQNKQGQGLATEVCEGIIAYAKEALETEKLYCLIQKGNVVSETVAEKLGFYFEKSIEISGKAMQRYLKILQT